MKYKFIISGGGTGGHIYPAVAIANELKTRFPDAEFLFVGAEDRMEMEKVPQAGYKIIGLWISGLQRSLSLQNLAFPLRVRKFSKEDIDILKVSSEPTVESKNNQTEESEESNVSLDELSEGETKSNEVNQEDSETSNS